VKRFVDSLGENMKIISWNVNGIRAVAKKGLADFLQKAEPDVLCLQETKISDSKREEHVFDFVNYTEYWHSARRPGYSGVLVLVKKGIKVLSHETKIGVNKFDEEGRVIILELEKFYLVDAYFPNANHELSRLDYKLEFNDAVLSYVKKLEKNPSTSLRTGKPVIICGDFNVAHEEIDIARPKDNIGNAGFTKEERNWMTKFLQAGFIDTFRFKNPKLIKYSWWSYRFFARQKNIGWRIDYFCVSRKLKDKIKKADIMTEVLGSDHCPIALELK